MVSYKFNFVGFIDFEYSQVEQRTFFAAGGPEFTFFCWIPLHQFI
ncbi:hypothetical protein TcasGA2_TC032321 [Tribolium castaneum]|uniref:Uncharacterized protein n=1 Tax=Tribolium castaneum TaxID=7070 RepID=A0A139WLB2_TRICA|nr:hypothetical protein TcasGA2_TC032321 [Tribolium castaneum]